MIEFKDVSFQYEQGSSKGKIKNINLTIHDGEIVLICGESGCGKTKRKLTKEMADAFVDSIIIRGKYDYEIKLVYDDQFADLQKLRKEKEAQSR